MMLSKFVKMNRNFCRKLEKNNPIFFSSSYAKKLQGQSGNTLRGLVKSFILENSPTTILEVGGVDRPILAKSRNYSYFGLDIDDKPKCYDVYDTFLVQSIEEELEIKFNLIISNSLLEHVPDNTRSLRVIYDALSNGGVTMHYIPSKYHFYSLILRLVGPKLQKILIHYLRPEAEAVTGYPAFFHKCSPRQMETLCKDIGFSKIEITPSYRATDYFYFFVPAFILVAVLENLISYFGLRTFASGMILVARK